MGAKRNLVLGRCAGIMFLGAAFAGIPAAHLLPGPMPSGWLYVVAAASALSGIVCLLAPWHRLSSAWLNLLPPVAIVQIASTSLIAGEDGEVFRWFYVLSAIYIAYAFRDRRIVVAHLTVLSASMIATGLVLLGDDASVVARNVVAIPTVCLAAGVVVYLRESLELRERTDVLTGLANRRALMEDLERVTAGERECMLALFDLDGFKRYNDRLGHQAGDELLERLGARLRRAVHGRGTAYRLGGDELCVLGDDPGLLAACDAALREGEISASHGSALLPLEAVTPSAALDLVDTRMYAAKRAARGASFVAEVSPASPTEPARRQALHRR